MRWLPRSCVKQGSPELIFAVRNLRVMSWWLFNFLAIIALMASVALQVSTCLIFYFAQY